MRGPRGGGGRLVRPEAPCCKLMGRLHAALRPMCGVWDPSQHPPDSVQRASPCKASPPIAIPKRSASAWSPHSTSARAQATRRLPRNGLMAGGRSGWAAATAGLQTGQQRLPPAVPRPNAGVLILEEPVSTKDGVHSLD